MIKEYNNIKFNVGDNTCIYVKSIDYKLKLVDYQFNFGTSMDGFNHTFTMYLKDFNKRINLKNHL